VARAAAALFGSPTAARGSGTGATAAGAVVQPVDLSTYRGVGGYLLDGEGRLRAVPDVGEVLDLIPADRMSGPARHFARRLYAENHASLSHPLRTMAP